MNSSITQTPPDAYIKFLAKYHCTPFRVKHLEIDLYLSVFIYLSLGRVDSS